MEVIPKEGFRGLKENWQSDLLAAFSVSMIALPLSLGIAVASGVPPIAGIFTAIIGGIVTTFFRGSHLAINGPAAGLIAVILVSTASLNDGTGNALNYVLAAIVVSGAIQVIMGLLKLGKLADLLHSTVIHGILAAIGVIIFTKQIHVALGTTASSNDIIQTLKEAVLEIPNINPYVAIISLMGLLLLLFHSRISYKFFHFLPAPMWVLVLSIPFVYAFNFFDPHTASLFGKDFQLGPQLLVQIPDNFLDAMPHPDFSKVDTLAFWTSVLSITLIATMVSLAGSKAVDKLDPYKRKTDLNKDLVGVGISTIVSGMLGGLPIITVIVRSTVNVNNSAKTKWSNLYHGLFLLAFVFLLTPIIQLVPLCALAILLVYTGFKLASPKVFAHVYEQGAEQLVFFVGTLLITLYTNLLIGMFAGLSLALLVHFLLAKMPVRAFFNGIFYSGSNIFIRDNGVYDVKIKGVANFLATIRIDNLLNTIPQGANVNIDLSEARLVDFSVMEHLYDFKRSVGNSGGKAEIVGLEEHVSSSNYKMALKIQTSTLNQLTARQISLREIAKEHNLAFRSEPNENSADFESFYYFKTRPIENITNRVTGNEENIDWEILDVRFEEGGLELGDEYDTTISMIKMPVDIPKFTIERKAFIDKYIPIARHKDIDYRLYDDLSDDYIVKVMDHDEMQNFITDELRNFIIKNEISHIESNGHCVLIFNNEVRLTKIGEYSKIIRLTEDLKRILEK